MGWRGAEEMWRAVEVVGSDEGGGEAAPGARGKHSATLADGHVYVLGGRSAAAGSRPLRDFWRYCLASGVWERLRGAGEAPPALQEHGAVARGGRLYVFGGEPAMSDDTPLWIYDIETQFWRKLPGPGARAPARRGRGRAAGPGAAGPGASGPGGRRGHSVHALDDCLLVYGGYRDLRGPTDEIWAFHYESEVWALAARGAGPARHRHAAALHAARLYVHAGLAGLRPCSDLHYYDTISRSWTQVRCARAPGARAGHAGLRAGPHFYIFGGELNGAPCNELWRFHFGTETWERIEQGLKWPSPRVDCCVLLLAGAAPRVRSAPAGGEAGGGREPAGGGGVGREPAGGGGVGREPAGGGGERGGGVGLLRELCRLAPRRGARYTALAAAGDSAESLAPLGKSRSALALPPPRLARDPLSVPDLTHAWPAPDTSDYCSASRLSSLGFTNPHYGAPLTPDSALGDVELRDLRPPSPCPPPPALHALVVGGREVAHPARLAQPLSMWTYRLL